MCVGAAAAIDSSWPAGALLVPWTARILEFSTDPAQSLFCQLLDIFWIPLIHQLHKS